MPGRRKTLLCLYLLATADRAAAVHLSPGDSELAAAVALGASLARPENGYFLGDYVVYAVPDARAIDPALGDVDAVVLATPLERIRHEAFLAARGGAKKVTPAWAWKAANVHAGWIGFTVFAHGPNGLDAAFARKFSVAKLVFPDRTLIAASVERSEPSDAIYPLAETNRNRYVATIVYRFDLTGSADLPRATARLQFCDDTGKAFDIRMDLARYR